MSPGAQHRWAVGDLARIHGGAPPFAEGERAGGRLTIRPGTIYLGEVEWWRYTDDPRVLFCTLCARRVTNYYLAIDHHVREHHAPDQI